MKNTIENLQDDILDLINAWCIDNRFDEITLTEERAIEAFITDLLFAKLFKKTDKLSEESVKG